MPLRCGPRKPGQIAGASVTTGRGGTGVSMALTSGFASETALTAAAGGGAACPQPQARARTSVTANATPAARRGPRVALRVCAGPGNVQHDLEFEKWARKVWQIGAGLGAEVSLQDFRKDIIIEVYNEAGQLVIAYKVYRCWVSEWQSLPDLDANANAVAIQHIKLENEGWERDLEVPEPSEPTFTVPAV